MKIERSSGTLLHITSLPGKYGIGTIGYEAYEFADKLKQAGQKYWQILPIGPVTESMAFSPYASPSTYAGNWLFISLEKLTESKWFTNKIKPLKNKDDNFISFKNVIKHKLPLLKAASIDFFTKADIDEMEKFKTFCEESKYWLNDFSLYSALSEHFDTNNWFKWDEEIKIRKPNAIKKWNALLHDQIQFHKFIQYLFFTQWKEFKEYCNNIGIKIIGDIPIYISLDGADSWSHPDILQLDHKTEKPISVSGVPPDYFSETGQRWGNPLYKWFSSDSLLNKKTFNWWAHRISHLNKLVDIIRIDHFRGFESYWSIPADEPTAINGKWVKGPGIKFFKKLRKKLGDLPLIAEDLGVITPEVEKLRDDLSLPGMKILQFAFDFNNKNYYLPHSYENTNFILYTGTHDNNTTNGWYYGNEIDDNTKKYILEYIGVDNYDEFHWKLIRQAYRSIAELVIFPVQDILGYGPEFRMNTPGTKDDNWKWKLIPDAITDKITNKLKKLGEMYNRI